MAGGLILRGFQFQLAKLAVSLASKLALLHGNGIFLP